MKPYFLFKKWLVQFLLSGLAFSGILSCIDPYTPPEINGGRGFLVVDGFLNLGSSTSSIRLSRTQNLGDMGGPEPIIGAQVLIEEENGNTYLPVTATFDGQYIFANQFGAGKKYRLSIQTGASSYLSDWVAARITPPIDSLSLDIAPEGVKISVTTNDPSNETRFYRWRFEETWEYVSPNASYYVYDQPRTLRARAEFEQIYRCWRSANSPRILIATSSQLSEDVIFKFPLAEIPNNNIRLGIKYSVKVEQYALSKQEFEYWDLLSKNNEELGGLFSPLPSRVVGNVRNISDPEEPVLGYFSAYSVSEIRKFYTRTDFPREWRINDGFGGCGSEQIDTLTRSEIFELPPNSFIVLEEIFGMFGPIGFTTTDASCSDCRTLGGTTQRPDFWQ